MQSDFVTLDVFTSTLYAGNPLGLVLIRPEQEAHLTQTAKQLIAREFNLSETAFLHLPASQSVSGEDGALHGGSFQLDIFMTSAELPFAGHPTIGAAWYVLNVVGKKQWAAATLITKSGPIEIGFVDGQTEVSALLSHNVHVHQRSLKDLKQASQDDYARAVSTVPAIAVAETSEDTKLVSIVKGMTFLCVNVPSVEMLATAKKDGRCISATGPAMDEGWNVGFVGKYYYVLDGWSERTDRRQKVRTRMIEDHLEDPATGSAASALSCFLALLAESKSRNGQGSEAKKYQITQGVEMGRESVINVDVMLKNDGSHGIESVKLSGDAVVVQEGEITIPTARS